MYSRNCGSNWPRSWAPIARSTRGSALIGPGPIRSRGAGLSSSRVSGMRMMFEPVARNVDAPRDPHLVLLRSIPDEPLQRGEAAGPAGEPAVQPDRHHARRALAFLVQHVQRVLEVLEELLARIEA